MRLKLQRERFDPWYAEALPLLEKHRLELAHYTDIPLDVDVPGYLAAEAAGTLRVFTARLDRGPSEPLTLIGYALFFVRANPHYQSSLQAVQDVLYLDPDQRKGAAGLGLINFVEQELRREGVEVIYHHVKKEHPTLGRLLVHRGYEEIESVFAKRFHDDEIRLTNIWVPTGVPH